MPQLTVGYALLWSLIKPYYQARPDFECFFYKQNNYMQQL